MQQGHVYTAQRQVISYSSQLRHSILNAGIKRQGQSQKEPQQWDTR